MSTIATKAEYFRRYSNGEFGNRLRTWNTLTEFHASGYAGDVVLRYSGAGGGTKLPRYGQRIPTAEVIDVVHQWEHCGASAQAIRLNESACDEHIILQGEILLTVEGIALFYSREKTKMRQAMENGIHVEGLRATLMLRHALFPASHDDLELLWEKYPASAIEFSTYSHAVGDCRGRNTIFWEVRNY